MQATALDLVAFPGSLYILMLLASLKRNFVASNLGRFVGSEPQIGLGILPLGEKTGGATPPGRTVAGRHSHF